MSQHAAWKELVRKSFRSSYTFPIKAAHNWFPGHMHKGLGQIQRRMADVDCVLEVHDARIPVSGRNLTFRENLNKSRPHLLLLNKHDLFPEEEKRRVRAELLDDTLTDVLWTNCKNRDDPGVTSIINTVSRELKRRSDTETKLKPHHTVLVVGIPNVGKSTLINKLRSHHLRVGGRPAPVAAKPGWTKAVGERIRVCDRPTIYLLDSPGISVPQITDMHSGMKLAACGTLKDNLVGEEHICDYLLFWLNLHHHFDYVELMGLQQPEDHAAVMLAKAAVNAGDFKRVKDISKGGMMRIPNITQQAVKFLKLFRSGQFGLVNLDTDMFKGKVEGKVKNIMEVCERLVMPGDDVTEDTEDKAGVVLGPGLRREAGDQVRVTKPGVMRARTLHDKRVVWVDVHCKRYVANRGENVIGVVVAKMGDTFRVDIGTSEPASLSYLAFEGATKRNRPNVNVGDIVYAKLLVASSHTEAELVCVDSYGKKAGLGVLTGGGFMFAVSLNLVRKLLAPDCGLLTKLGEVAPFETAVGVNGRVWLRARSVKETMLLAQAVTSAEYMTAEEIAMMCDKLADVMAGF